MTSALATPDVRAVIFDLDGTLVQTRAASWAIFKQVSDRFDLGVDSQEQYFDLFQGNVFRSIEKLCGDNGHAEEVKAAFLDLLREDYRPQIVPGIAEVVRTLATHCTLAVMSSNAMTVLRRVLVDNDVALCFAHVFGGDVTPDKRSAIRAFLADAGSGFGRRCAADYDETGHIRSPDLASTVLVTDTAGDVRDAVQTGIRVVGVAWGMHTPDELTAAGAEFVALWPQELSAYLLGDAASAGPGGTCAVSHPQPPRPATGSDCGCGCAGVGSCRPTDPVLDAMLAAGSVRRERRRTAACSPEDSRDAATTLPPELLAAVRRVVGSR